jgi:asparagine synthase (glutamine-hydrolysing)
MCGVCGSYNYRDGNPVDPAVLRAMCDSLVHRGPDDEGAHVEGSLGLAMRRLAIVDPASGQQPLYSEDGQIVLVANGEIYNSPALRAELIARGHTFKSGSDCEVVVHLYEELGDACLERLQGMFGLALYDRRRRRLLLARDRLGIKPLYYADVGGTLRFGSEIKALLQDPGLERRLDPRGVHHYLSLNYVPAPYTLLRGVRQLLPGECLTCDAAGVQRRTYWDLRFGGGDAALGEAEWARRLRDKLAQCVASHLMSDVPFGAFLSGGIDSSAVVGLMTEALGGPVQTFSVDFAEKSYSEARFAQLVADRFGSQHHLLQASPAVVDLLPTLIWHADDPLADSSMLPVYLVSEFARRRVTMVQTGDGADELFAGYETYQAHYIRRLYRMVPGWIRRKLIAEAVGRLPVSMTKVSLDFKAKRFVAGAELDAEAAHFWWRQILSSSAKMELYSDAFREQLHESERDKGTLELYRGYFSRSGTADPLDRMLYVDTRFYLPSDMLVKVDRMTMANALEARVPFLDHELAELAASIPASIKFSRLRKKHVLKRALRGLLPPQILDRKKAGFNVPINAWLAGELRPLAERILAPEQLERVGCFRPAVVGRMLAEHQQRRADHSFALWGLICLQLWHGLFVEPASVEPPSEVAQRWRSHLRPERAAPWPGLASAS